MAIWRSLIAKQAMQIWQSCIAKYLMAIWHYFIAKCTRAIWWHLITKQTLAILATSYCLNRNDRVSSFYWTNYIFSHVSLILVATFLILVFSKNCYSLISLRLSRLHGNLISCPVFLYLWHSELVHCTCAPMFLEQNMWVSWNKMLVGTWQ